MRPSQTPPSLLSLLFILLQTKSCQAGPYPRDDLHDFGFSYLQDRDCATYCGADNQYCCTAGQACFTNAADIAYCSAGAAVVTTGYAVYTTTYTETDLVLRTSTYSSWYEVATSTYVTPVTTDVPAICTTSLGESSCGTICCASDQQCAFANSCTAYTSTYIATATSTYSAPLRVTSGGVSTTQTSTVSATTTQPYISPATASGSSLPVTSSSSNNGLSGGAIAGIVIGTIAGVLLLLLLCFCCIVKAGFDGLLAIFGLGKKRRSRETIITEERYSRHGSGTASRRDTHTGWFGAGRGSRPARVDEKRKKSSGIGGWGVVGAGLIGLAVILGLKKRDEKKKTTTVGGRSDVSSSYYSHSYTGTSASSASSDRRTRDTRRSTRR